MYYLFRLIWIVSFQAKKTDDFSFPAFLDIIAVLYIPWAVVQLYTTLGPEEQGCVARLDLIADPPLYRLCPGLLSLMLLFCFMVSTRIGMKLFF